MSEHVDLYTLLTKLRRGVAELFPYGVWVTAEIASMKLNPNGHCYMELSQSDSRKEIAKCRAVAWNSDFRLIWQKFFSETHLKLDAGMKVCVLVQVSYHEMYGMALTVRDIQSEYTLGDREKRKNEARDRLKAEGLLDLQKESRALPAVPYYLAVISSETAAGYGDFRRHLDENGYGFRYRADLFQAVMQGREAPSSIAAAIDRVLDSSVPYDAVLIIRGGGSELDLSCFDEYETAAAIAKCPLPVFTAIGHDRDVHLADETAYLSVKTPTALADWFIGCTASEDERICSLGERLARAFASRISICAGELDFAERRISGAASSRLDREDAAVDKLELRVRSFLVRLSSMETAAADLERKITGSASLRLAREQVALERLEVRIGNCGNRLSIVLMKADEVWKRIASAVLIRVMAEEGRMNETETRLRSSDPRNILKRGYSLALNGRGVRISSVKDVERGGTLRVRFSDGEIGSEIKEIVFKDEIE